MRNHPCKIVGLVALVAWFGCAGGPVLAQDLGQVPPAIAKAMARVPPGKECVLKGRAFTVSKGHSEEEGEFEARFYRDSIVWVSFKVEGLEIVRVLVTNDSLRFLDMQEKTYMAMLRTNLGDGNDISQMVSPQVIQSLAYGTLSGLATVVPTSGWKPGTKPGTYQSGKLSGVSSASHIVVSLGQVGSTQPDALQELRFVMEQDKELGLLVTFGGYRDMGGYVLPTLLGMTATGDSEETRLRLTDYRAAAGQAYPFKVPEDFARLQPED